MYEIILDVFAYMMLLSVRFLVPEKEKEKRSHVVFRLRFQLPAGSSRRFNLRRFEDSELTRGY